MHPLTFDWLITRAGQPLQSPDVALNVIAALRRGSHAFRRRMITRNLMERLLAHQDQAVRVAASALLAKAGVQEAVARNSTVPQRSAKRARRAARRAARFGWVARSTP